MLGKPFLSVQLGLKIADPSVLSRMGKIETILKKQELFDELEAFLLNSRRAKRIKLTFTKGAGDSILNIISDYAED